MYKTYNSISPTIINEIFTLRHQNQHFPRNWANVDVPKVRTVNDGSESIRYLGPKIWEIIPTHVKGLDTIDKFKVAITNGNQNLLCVGYVISIYKILTIYRLEHKFVALFSHNLWSCKYRPPSNYGDMEIFCDCS